MTALIHPIPAGYHAEDRRKLGILDRLEIVERRFRLLDNMATSDFAAMCAQDIRNGAPERLYVNWTNQLEERVDRLRAERDAALVAASGVGK